MPLHVATWQVNLAVGFDTSCQVIIDGLQIGIEEVELIALQTLLQKLNIVEVALFVSEKPSQMNRVIPSCGESLLTFHACCIGFEGFVNLIESRWTCS